MIPVIRIQVLETYYYTLLFALPRLICPIKSNSFIFSVSFEGVASLNQSALSRPMQRKLVTLVNCQLVEEEGRVRAMRAARSLGERTVTELILQHQNPQQLSANLWAAVRARGCQFLGPGTVSAESATYKYVLFLNMCKKNLGSFFCAVESAMTSIFQLYVRKRGRERKTTC